MNLEIEAYEGELRELRKAAEMALITLEEKLAVLEPIKYAETIEALRQALAQPEQEPVGYVTIENISSWAQVPSIKWFKKPTEGPLYTAPPKREWVGIGEKEVAWLWFSMGNREGINGYDFAKAIEAKLKERNT